MSVITLAQASTIVDAALKKGRDTNCFPLTVAVLDTGMAYMNATVTANVSAFTDVT